MRKKCFHWAGQEFMLHFLCNVGAKSPLSGSTTTHPCHVWCETTVCKYLTQYTQAISIRHTITLCLRTGSLQMGYLDMTCIFGLLHSKCHITMMKHCINRNSLFFHHSHDSYLLYCNPHNLKSQYIFQKNIALQNCE